MELKFDVLKPNLYIVNGNELYFSSGIENIVSIVRDINTVLKENIGELKVPKSDMDVFGSGKIEPAYKFDTPITEYLDLLSEKDISERLLKGAAIGNVYSDFFGTGYLIDAATIESPGDIRCMAKLLEFMNDSVARFDEIEKNCFLRLDRKESFAKIKKKYEALKSKTPKNYATLHVMSSEFPLVYNSAGGRTVAVGLVELGPSRKAAADPVIKKILNELSGKLETIEGPSLSYDTPIVFRQIVSLYDDAPFVLANYGDVSDPNFSARMFRLE